MQREFAIFEKVAASGFHLDQIKWQEFIARGMFRGLGLESIRTDTLFARWYYIKD